MWAWLMHLTGPSGRLGWFFSVTGRWYGVGSGWGTAYFAGGIWLRHQNCHVKGCWRLGRHPHGAYKLCLRHHPGAPDRRRDITAELVKAHRPGVSHLWTGKGPI